MELLHATVVVGSEPVRCRSARQVVVQYKHASRAQSVWEMLHPKHETQRAVVSESSAVFRFLRCGECQHAIKFAIT